MFVTCLGTRVGIWGCIHYTRKSTKSISPESPVFTIHATSDAGDSDVAISSLNDKFFGPQSIELNVWRMPKNGIFPYLQVGKS